MKKKLNFRKPSFPLSHWFIRRSKISKSVIEDFYVCSSSNIFQTNGYEVFPPKFPISKIINHEDII